MTTLRIRLVAEERKAQIVKEAELLIRTNGFQGFSISALAEACGLTRAGVLHHVGSKDQLLIDVLEAKERETSEETFALINAIGHPTAREVLDLLMRRNMERPEIMLLLTVLGAESLNPKHPAHDYFAERLQRGARRLAPLLGGARDDAENAAIEILSYMDGLQLNWLRDRKIDLWARWSAFADRYFGDSR